MVALHTRIWFSKIFNKIHSVLCYVINFNITYADCQVFRFLIRLVPPEFTLSKYYNLYDKKHFTAIP